MVAIVISPCIANLRKNQDQSYRAMAIFSFFYAFYKNLMEKMDRFFKKKFYFCPRYAKRL